MNAQGRKLWILVAILASIFSSVYAQTNVSGYILSNTTWTLANSPYIVTGNILVNNGVTLTIEPGVVVKFDSTRTLQIDGELIAIGTASDRITFTASSQSPTKGSWGRIQFKNSSTDAIYNANGVYVSGSILKFCDIIYGGGIGNTGVVDCDTSSPHISHCRISYSKTAGIYFNRAANSGVDSSSIKYCDGNALYYNYPTATDLTIEGDSIVDTKGISGYAGYVTSGTQFNFVFTNAVFTNNVFMLNRERTIALTVYSCTVSGNAFISNSSIGYGYTYDYNDGMIFLNRTNYCLITDNEFRQNNLSVPGLSGYFGSVINVIGHAVISNNVFISNRITSGYTENAVVIRGGQEVSDNYFEDNNNILSNVGVVRCNRFIQNQSIYGQDLFTSSLETIVTTVEYNIFENNVADVGRSLWKDDGYNSVFANNLFKNNTAPNGSIISFSGYSSNSGTDVYNNSFIDNSALNCLYIISPATISNNNFQNPGVQYEINNSRPWGTPNVQADNNYWGTGSIAHVDSVIYDFFDDGTYSVVFYVPVLTAPASVDTSCPLVICSLSVSGTAFSPSCYAGSNGSINLTVSNGTAPYGYNWSNGAGSEDIGNLVGGSYSVTVTDANLCSATKSFVLSQPSSPVSVVSGVVTNANCNTGGSINISAGGGTAPYTYNWGSGITTQNRTGLNPGSYSVTVSDNYNCSATQSFTVGQDAGPIISGATTNTSCSNSCDGAIDVSVSGVAPFMYDWGSGFGASEDTSGLCTGTYNVTVADSNNCGIATSFTITSPAALVASASIATDVSCFGFSDGAALANASGGTAPYSFLWSDGQATTTAASLSAGTYDVVVTDSLGCMDTASVSIPDGYNVFAGAIGGPTSVGINQSVTYIVSANPDYSYGWSVLNGLILSGQGSNSIEVAWTSAGTGLVQVIAQEQGCADTVSKSVTVIDTAQNCSAQFYLYPDTIPHSYFVVNTTSGIPQLSYSWNWGDGSPPDTDAYPSHTYNAAGFYTICLTITDSAGCTDTYCNPYFLLKAEDESSAMIQVNVVPPTFTGAQNAALENVVVYPNPTNGFITLQAGRINGQVALMIFDAMGKQLLQKSLEGSELLQGAEVDLSSMKPGIYFLKVRFESGYRFIKLIRN